MVPLNVCDRQKERLSLQVKEKAPTLDSRVYGFGVGPICPFSQGHTLFSVPLAHRCQSEVIDHVLQIPGSRSWNAATPSLQCLVPWRQEGEVTRLCPIGKEVKLTSTRSSPRVGSDGANSKQSLQAPGIWESLLAVLILRITPQDPKCLNRVEKEWFWGLARRVEIPRDRLVLPPREAWYSFP